MPAIAADPELARAFARDVVHRLRGAGYEALWAGGCVRDELLHRTPADYDVATSALPDEVRTLFGRSRTLAVGAAFGVITVIGPRGAGQVEVTTFRTDAAYVDGRHPAAVVFSSPAEDARRRDFTINGLFLDPVTGDVHDHVGGRADLEAGVVRAIGIAEERFAEDHLRMLRAVRFAAGFGFVLETGTRAAIERLAPRVATVSPERIAAELRTMMERTGRGEAVRLLVATGLAAVVLPELSPPGAGNAAEWEGHARLVDALSQPGLPLALAIFAEGRSATLAGVCARLRLSNRETSAAVWLRQALDLFADPGGPSPACRKWSEVQPWMAARDAPLLADVLSARAALDDEDGESRDRARWVAECVARPREILDPPPLLGGGDLLRAGIPAGPAMGRTLAELRARQLDGEVRTAEEARAWLARRGGD